MRLKKLMMAHSAPANNSPPVQVSSPAPLGFPANDFNAAAALAAQDDKPRAGLRFSL
jgi:hypothetical protein